MRRFNLKSDVMSCFNFVFLLAKYKVTFEWVSIYNLDAKKCKWLKCKINVIEKELITAKKKKKYYHLDREKRINPID